MGPIGCPETSVINYQYSLHNNPEERSSELLRGGNLNLVQNAYLLEISFKQNVYQTMKHLYSLHFFVKSSGL